MQLLADLVRNRSVALVGNAASILTKDLGVVIDAHEVVIRINLGLPHRLPADACGRRTTIWATAKHWPGECPKDVMAVLFMKLTALGDKHWSALMAESLPQPCVRWPLDLEERVHRFVGADPGTGIRLLWWLRHECSPSTVGVYGMDCWQSKTHWSGRGHTPNHVPELERIALEKLR